MQDLIILGGGAAGLTAAIYAARARLDAVVLERSALTGGQALETAEIENYPGLPHCDGPALAAAFAEQARALGADIRTAAVTGWTPLEGGFAVDSSAGRFAARALLIAAGAAHRPLDVPGEERLRGRGVSCCATCDGRFFKGRRVAVVGGGNTAAEEALYLSRLCDEVVLLHRRDRLRAGRALQERLFAADNITLRWNTTVAAVEGENRVESLRLRTPQGEESLPVAGVFIAVGLRPNTALFPTLPQDKQGFLLANEDGETPVPGIFAAGDVRSKRCRQIVTAAADGAAAVAAAERYLSRA